MSSRVASGRGRVREGQKPNSHQKCFLWRGALYSSNRSEYTHTHFRSFRHPHTHIHMMQCSCSVVVAFVAMCGTGRAIHAMRDCAERRLNRERGENGKNAKNGAL